MTLSGKVVAGKTVTVAAPFGGRLNDFLVRQGDMVKSGDVLFTLETTKVYAPCDGTVGSVGARVGDDAAYLQERYGAVMYLEPAGRFIIESNTKEAYGTQENLLVHLGETVYLGSRNSSGRSGIGFISAVDNEKYTVEVTAGNLVMEDNVAVYRSADFDPKTKIGVGTTQKNPVVPVKAEGSLYKLHVEQGQSVRRGDLLFETAAGSLAYNPYPTNHVLAGYDAVVATVDVAHGAQVSQNQTLAALYPLDGLQVAAEVMASDLSAIRVGDRVRIERAGIYDQETLAGVIVSVSGLSAADTDEPMYTVYIAPEDAGPLRPGMEVNVYLNE